MINNSSKPVIAFLLNLLVAPGLGELYIKHIADGKKLFIYYSLWSILALILSIISIGILIPLLFMVDTAIRIITACDVYTKSHNKILTVH